MCGLETEQPTISGSDVDDEECVAEAVKREIVTVDDVHVTIVEIFTPFLDQLSSGWIVNC